ncbi:MAG TPA: site-2 protease family protein [Candidatus Eisenbacteria bacterium]|nr:site-2 protease family protein [Candidatus Eisenbacteria bacterium]
MDLKRDLIMYVALVIALVGHEYIHALVGYLMGDETAKRMGRLTLNPLAHADLVGTLILPLMAILSHFPVIGWAKPVPFNPYNLRNQKWGPTIVALSGPLSNFGMALVFIIGLKLVLGAGLPINNLLAIFLGYLVVINVVLGLFNFIPVPPLDGSKLLTALLDSPKYRRFLFLLETRGPMILLFIILLDLFSPVPFLGYIFGGAVNFAFSAAGLRSMLAML